MQPFDQVSLSDIFGSAIRLVGPYKMNGIKRIHDITVELRAENSVQIKRDLCGIQLTVGEKQDRIHLIIEGERSIAIFFNNQEMRLESTTVGELLYACHQSITDNGIRASYQESMLIAKVHSVLKDFVNHKA